MLNSQDQSLFKELRTRVIGDQLSPWALSNVSGVSILRVDRLCRNLVCGATAPELKRIKWALENRADLLYRRNSIENLCIEVDSQLSSEILSARLKEIRGEFSQWQFQCLVNISSTNLSKMRLGDPSRLAKYLPEVLRYWEEDLIKFFSTDWRPSTWKGLPAGPGSMLTRMARFHNLKAGQIASLLGVRQHIVAEYKNEEAEISQKKLSRFAHLLGFPESLVEGVCVDGGLPRMSEDYLSAWTKWFQTTQGNDVKLSEEAQEILAPKPSFHQVTFRSWHDINVELNQSQAKPMVESLSNQYDVHNTIPNLIGGHANQVQNSLSTGLSSDS